MNDIAERQDTLVAQKIPLIWGKNRTSLFLRGSQIVNKIHWLNLPFMRKARPTVAGAWGLAVWLVNPQSPRVLLSSSNWSSCGTKVEHVTGSPHIDLKLHEHDLLNIKTTLENIVVAPRKDKLHGQKDTQINFCMARIVMLSVTVSLAHLALNSLYRASGLQVFS